jgi:hypothetical protein
MTISLCLSCLHLFINHIIFWSGMEWNGVGYRLAGLSSPTCITSWCVFASLRNRETSKSHAQFSRCGVLMRFLLHCSAGTGRDYSQVNWFRNKVQNKIASLIREVDYEGDCKLVLDHRIKR